MTKHMNDGQLRAALDGEASSEELEHIEGCESCRAKMEALRLQAQPAARELAFLSGTAKETVPPAGPALARFHHNMAIKKENSMFQRLFNNRVLRFGSAVVVILALVLTVPATRAMAAQLLGLFRVKQVTVIPVDFSGMQQLTGNSTLGKQIGQMLSDSVVMTQKPTDPITVADAAEASKEAGFNVRLPQNLTPSRISVDKGFAFSFKVDRERAQALIDEAGRKDLQLPASIDGAEVSVSVPAGISAGYGNCPAPTTDEQAANRERIANGTAYADCILVAEIPSPTVSAPADVDIAQLAQIGLEFTGMSPDQAAEYTKTVDWTSSLVIPIPRNAASYEKITVDGVTGTLIQRPADDVPQYALIWVKDGVIYAIGGNGSDTQKALDIAASLP